MVAIAPRISGASPVHSRIFSSDTLMTDKSNGQRQPTHTTIFTAVTSGLKVRRMYHNLHGAPIPGCAKRILVVVLAMRDLSPRDTTRTSRGAAGAQ
mmetsp:Transcript_27849/g.75042  ORF Transcript_27849/g.75042 Transcript_27849/m.75042 type:complete len:96 (-) Transcript_27849:269-556(-)|eukprot:CAMPEP_0185210454 /NCGR_PEP_ID=MMETSP1140-20130426/65658_1 /TAXON_ID=298111 /ORGANISM="Pavlova sp., Strain CCMP459" /LENGTH=95 /DNA_ID=CAMNT_0027778263 /DNA_START=74 /DNA_END=361 /DNA_ORIENTATION=-